MKYQAVARKFDKLFLGRRMIFFRAFQNNGLYPGQLPILEYVMQNQGCTQKEIADKLLVSAPSIASSTKRLQKAGLLKKQTDETNLRQNKLFITEKGVLVGEKCRDEFNQHHETFFQGFSDQDLTALGVFLDRIILNMSEEMNADCLPSIDFNKETER